MILAGEIERLAAEYRASWSGLCRGKARTAYTIEAEGPVLRSDFVRWLGRRAAKNREGGAMILKQIEERSDPDHPEEKLSILVFKGPLIAKSVETMIAEVIVELGPDKAVPRPGVELSGVPAIAIRLASFLHSASCIRRLGAMRAKFQKAKKNGLGVEGPVAYRYDRKRDVYHFGAEFMSWVRQEYFEKEPGSCIE